MNSDPWPPARYWNFRQAVRLAWRFIQCRIHPQLAESAPNAMGHASGNEWVRPDQNAWANEYAAARDSNGWLIAARGMAFALIGMIEAATLAGLLAWLLVSGRFARRKMPDRYLGELGIREQALDDLSRQCGASRRDGLVWCRIQQRLVPPEPYHGVRCAICQRRMDQMRSEIEAGYVHG